MLFAGTLLFPRAAGAQPASRPPADPTLPSPAKLDGVYLALGPVGALVHVEDDWDGAFGGEISLWRVRERAVVSAVGAALGGHKFSERDGGQVWAELLAAHRTVWGLAIGLGAGGTVALDEFRSPRWGAHGELWVFAGVIPYVRIGSVEASGAFLDFGVKIALPAVRW